MGGLNLIQEGIEFSATDDLMTRRDFETDIEQVSTTDSAGKPVPVIFGTRFVDMTVTGWRPVPAVYRYQNRSTVNQYIDRVISTPPQPQTDRTNIPEGEAIRWTILEARMVICCGRIDRDVLITVDGVDLSYDRRTPSQFPTQYRGSSAGRDYFNIVKNWYADRYIINSTYSMILFDDETDGIGGFEVDPNLYTDLDPYSEWWLVHGDEPADPTRDILVSNRIGVANAVRGVSSFYFYGFNFGNKDPLRKWRIKAQRIHWQTTWERSTPGRYAPSWEPDGVRVSTNVLTERKLPVDRQSVLIVSNASSLANPVYTMNPIVALRESLTNPEWGLGIPEDRIDDGAFSIAAEVCFNDHLDYCFVHDRLGGPDQLIESIINYVDGVLYYDAASDRVRIRLVREDYTLASIPHFDESNIATIVNYRSQHGDTQHNSVTIKFYNVRYDREEILTLHNQEAVNRAGKIVSATINYPGCATSKAALVVAQRELTSLSRSVITCTAVLNSNERLGLGDPIVISYRDLGIARIVMRVSRIDYGDGLTGGIKVDLIQDVFADLTLFGDLVGDELPPIEPPVLPDFDDLIVWSEPAQTTIRSRMGLNVTGGTIADRYIEAGIRYDKLLTSNTTVTLNDDVALNSIGSLSHQLEGLNSLPDAASERLLVYVLLHQSMTAETIFRIDDEVMQGRVIHSYADNLHEIYITRRAIWDTVATSHSQGANVWFLNSTWYPTPASKFASGSTVVARIRQGVIFDREEITPDINFIGRFALPFPAEWVGLRGSIYPRSYQYYERQQIDGSIVIRLRPRANSLTPTQSTLVTIATADNPTVSLYTDIRQNSVPTVMGGQIPTQTFVVGTDVLPSTATTLIIKIEGIIGEIRSWQSWNYVIDWSPTDRSSLRRGWNFNWGNDWSGDTVLTGFGFNFNQDFGTN